MSSHVQQLLKGSFFTQNNASEDSSTRTYRIFEQPYKSQSTACLITLSESGDERTLQIHLQTGWTKKKIFKTLSKVSSLNIQWEHDCIQIKNAPEDIVIRTVETLSGIIPELTQDTAAEIISNERRILAPRIIGRSTGREPTEAGRQV